jgi:hypothetical protein
MIIVMSCGSQTESQAKPWSAGEIVHAWFHLKILKQLREARESF